MWREGQPSAGDLLVALPGWWLREPRLPHVEPTQSSKSHAETRLQPPNLRQGTVLTSRA